MGSNQSQSNAATSIAQPPLSSGSAYGGGTKTVNVQNINENEAGESTHINDLIDSGRYKVAKPETLEMMKAIQQPRQENVIYPDSEVKDLKQYIIEQEGLDIGKARRKALAQQWRFFLSCEPLQRGLDAGIILGSFSAAFVAYWNPRNRIPATIGLVWIGGFCVGMLSVPLLVIAADSYNTQRIKRLEQEMFSKQRSDFYTKMKGD